MKRTLFLLTCIMIIDCSVALALGLPNTIGLYLDPNGENVCEAAGLSEGHAVYLILKNATEHSGVSAWQGTLHVDPGLFVLQTTLSGSAVNYGNGNDFLVGVGPALPWSPTIVLAEFWIYAVSGGGMRFDRLESEDEFYPVYAAGDNPSTTVDMRLEYGGGTDPSLTIGMPGCPSLNHTGPSAPVFSVTNIEQAVRPYELALEEINDDLFIDIAIADESVAPGGNFQAQNLINDAYGGFSWFWGVLNPSAVHFDLVVGALGQLSWTQPDRLC